MAPRKVDERRTRKVLRTLERLSTPPEGAAGLSAWEEEFARSLEARVRAYGSAFRDAAKGRLEEPLSRRQDVKLREVAAKASGKRKPGLARSPLKRKTPMSPRRPPRVRDLDEDPSEGRR